ncbi:hypothetical protein ACWCXB_12125 [Streptomyces sp. NPDC001514]
MPMIEHDGGGAYALRILYSVPDDAWYLERENPDRAPLDRMTEDGWTVTDDGVAASGTTYE